MPTLPAAPRQASVPRRGCTRGSAVTSRGRQASRPPRPPRQGQRAAGSRPVGVSLPLPKAEDTDVAPPLETWR